jgi:hypothetical protein
VRGNNESLTFLKTKQKKGSIISIGEEAVEVTGRQKR